MTSVTLLIFICCLTSKVKVVVCFNFGLVCTHMHCSSVRTLVYEGIQVHSWCAIFRICMIGMHFSEIARVGHLD